MNMRRHFVKKYIFTILFLGGLIVFAGINGWKEIPYLKEYIANTVFTKENAGVYVEGLEKTINDNIAGKYGFVELYGLEHLVLGKEEENNFKYIKDEKGFLYSGESWYASKEESKKIADKTEQIKTMADNYGSQTMVLLPPVKSIENQDESGFPKNEQNLAGDYYLEAVEKIGIPALDLRQSLSEAGIAQEDMFYKTDHHWKTPAAFQAFCDLIEMMNNTYKLNLDEDGFYRNENHYNHLNYEQSFLGSAGREAGILYSGLDDFILMYPKFATHLKYQYTPYGEEKPVEREGRVEDTLLFTGFLANEDIYLNDKYSTYLVGVLKEDYIENMQNQEGPKILFIRDSYVSPVAAFLAPLCSRLDMVWGIEYDGDIEKLMKENAYDYVIVAMSPLNFSDRMFPFLSQ